DLRSRRESSEGLRLFVDSVQDYAILALDPEGRVVRSNAGAERLLGYSRQELAGRAFGCIFTADEVRRGVPEQELRRAAEAGRASDDRWHARKDGTFFFANGVTTPLRDDRGVLRGIVDRQMRRLARLIDDLLDVSRIRTGKVELRKSRVDLNALIGHAVDGVRPLCEDRGHTLAVSLPPEPVWVDADPNRIEQVLANL